MRGIRSAGRFAALVLLGVLAGCGGSLPPPDWKMNARSGMEGFEKHYLDGHGKLADLNFAKARAEASRTGRPDLVARLELARCAIRAAALEFDTCPGFEALREQAGAEEKAYAGFLAGNWRDVDGALLPRQYAPVLSAGDDSGRGEALAGIRDPVSRLIAAGVLLRSERITPAGLRIAVDTASDQGWRRPLLAWLKVQLHRAEAAGDGAAAILLRQRLELVGGSVPGGAGP